MWTSSSETNFLSIISGNAAYISWEMDSLAQFLYFLPIYSYYLEPHKPGYLFHYLCKNLSQFKLLKDRPFPDYQVLLHGCYWGPICLGESQIFLFFPTKGWEWGLSSITSTMFLSSPLLLSTGPSFWIPGGGFFFHSYNLYSLSLNPTKIRTGKPIPPSPSPFPHFHCEIRC